jgi:hypothetical protein
MPENVFGAFPKCELSIRRNAPECINDGYFNSLLKALLLQIPPLNFAATGPRKAADEFDDLWDFVSRHSCSRPFDDFLGARVDSSSQHDKCFDRFASARVARRDNARLLYRRMLEKHSFNLGG